MHNNKNHNKIHIHLTQMTNTTLIKALISNGLPPILAFSGLIITLQGLVTPTKDMTKIIIGTISIIIALIISILTTILEQNDTTN